MTTTTTLKSFQDYYPLYLMMDPSSVHSWVNQSRKYMQSAHAAAAARSMSLPAPVAGSSYMQPAHRWAPGNYAQSPPQPGPSTDEPLDLTMRPGEGAPLDLSVGKSSVMPVERELPAGLVRRSVTTDASYTSRREDTLYKSSGVHSPAVLSPGALPPGILSPRLLSPGVGMPYLLGPPIDKPPPPLVSPILRCTHCHYVTISSVELQRHRANVHGSSAGHAELSRAPKLPPPVSSSQPSDERLHCSYCGYQCELSNTQAFYAHLGKHKSNASQFVCFHCERVFPDQNMLREHILVHRNLNHYVCSLCSLAFGKQSMFAAHMHRQHRSLEPSGRSPQHSLSSFEPSPKKPNYGMPSWSSRSSSATPVTTPPSVSTLANLSPPASDHTAVDCPPPQTFGQCLFKEIESVIHHHVAGGKTPSLSDVMFMKSCGTVNGANTAPTTRAADTTWPRKNPLNLMSLLDKVVEQSLRSANGEVPPEKPSLKFMVTFSDDEEDKVNACDSTVATTAASSATNNVEKTGLTGLTLSPGAVRDASYGGDNVTSSKGFKES